MRIVDISVPDSRRFNGIIRTKSRVPRQLKETQQSPDIHRSALE
jgi:hypothetical protein